MMGDPGMAAVRAAAQGLEEECLVQDKKAFSFNDLADRLGIQNYKGKERLRRSEVYVLVKGGELVRLAPGCYRYKGKPARRPTIEERMWFILRKRGTVTADYLSQMADTSQKYALDFLHRLRPKFVMKIEKAGQVTEFSLINDPGQKMPKNEAKAAYLRQRRAGLKQEAIARLDEVYHKSVELMQSAAAARLAMAELEDE